MMIRDLEDRIAVGDALSFGVVTAIQWDGENERWDITTREPFITTHANSPSLRRLVVEAQHTAAVCSMALIFCQNDAEWTAAVADARAAEQTLNAVLAPLDLCAAIYPSTTYYSTLTDPPTPCDYPATWPGMGDDDEDEEAAP